MTRHHAKVRLRDIEEFELEYSDAGKRRILAGLDDLHRDGASNEEIADYLSDWGVNTRKVGYWRRRAS